MKKILVVALAIVGTSCGGIKLPQDVREALKKGAVNHTAHTFASGLLDVDSLAGGIHALTPNVDVGTSLTLAPALRGAPGLAPEPCSLPGQHLRITGDKNDYRADQDEKSAKLTIDATCIAGYWQPTTVHADVTYKDGGSGTIHIIEDPEDTRDENVLTGFVKVTGERNFPANDERAKIEIEARLDLGGDFDYPTRPRFAKYLRLIVTMRNGAVVDGEILPEQPIEEGKDMVKGIAKRTTRHASGPITMTTEIAEVKGQDIGTYELVHLYAHGEKDTVHVEADGNTVKLIATGHDGYQREGKFNKADGSFELTTTFPATSPIEKIEESGTWKKQAGTGSYKRHVYFRNGREEELELEKVMIAANSLSGTFKYEVRPASTEGEAAKPEKLSGDIKIVKSELDITIDVTITNETGDTATLHEVRYPDGTSKQNYTKDVKATFVNPDERGEFTFAADGSGTGTVTVQTDNGVTVTFQVTIDAHGNVTATQQ